MVLLSCWSCGGVVRVVSKMVVVVVVVGWLGGWVVGGIKE